MGATNDTLSDPDAFVSANEGALNAIMFSIFEKLAGVTPKEKEKYDLI